MIRTLRPPAALALAIVALGIAGCSDTTDGSDTGDNNAANRNMAVKFAECMRDNGVSEFPDPDASGEMTIDGVLNGSSIDSDGPAWKNAIAACKDLQPPGFTGDNEVTAEERDSRLAFARCIRENGVKDFPDPVDGEPLVDTNRIPSANREGGMTILNAAMQACRDEAPADVKP